MITSPPIRVFLCDDVGAIRELVRLALEHDPNVLVVGEAGDGNGCVDNVADTRANVVLLDLAMPELDGLEAIPLIRERAPDARIIVFSGFSASRFADTAKTLGAVRYIEKGTSLDELRAAVHAAAPSS